MGDSTHAACRTCRKSFYLGCGSYSSAERRRTRFPAHEHEGHDVLFWGGDFESGTKDGNLMCEIGYGKEAVLVEGYTSMEHIDLSDVPLPPKEPQSV